MGKERIQTGIRLEPEILRKISFIAKQNKRSLNAQFEYLAMKCVVEYEKENGEIVIKENADEY